MPSGSGTPMARIVAWMRSSRPTSTGGAVAGIVEGDGGADHLLLLALGEDDALRGLARTRSEISSSASAVASSRPVRLRA